MKCQRCETENPDDARKCQSCGRVFRRKPQGQDAEEALSPEAEAYYQRARWVYWWAWASILPPVGIVVGPVAAAMAWWVGRQRQDGWPGGPTLLVSLGLGLLSAVTQAAGLWLIVASMGSG